MSNRAHLVDSDPAAILDAIERLEHRVTALEHVLADVAIGSGHGPASSALPFTNRFPFAPADAPLEQASPPPAHDWTAARTITLAGRTLMALGGAYLLRALTEGGVVAPHAGVTIGFVYAVLWLALAWRGAAGTPGPNAAFHGLTAALVAYPLVWETTSRFALVTPVAGALVLGVFTALMLLTARHCRLETVAWFGAIGTTITAITLAVSTAAVIPFTVVVALTGVAALWLGYVDNWVGIRWPVAAAADLMVLAAMVVAFAPNGRPLIAPTVALQLFVVGIYLASIVARTLVLGREVIPFEVVQSAAAVAVGFGGALALLTSSGASAVPLGAAALVLGGGAYAFAFAFVEPRRHWRNLAFFTSLAAAFSLAGVILVLPLSIAVIVIGAMALLCAEWARRSRRLTLAVHAAVFAAVMAWLSGLVGAATAGLAGPATGSWPVIDRTMALAFVVMASSVAWPEPPALAHLTTGSARALRLARLALLVWVAAGVLVILAAPMLAGAGGTAGDAAVLATIRTVVLAALTVLVMAAPRHPTQIERIWLGYVLLALIGFKLLAEDLPQGRPATLFVALATYGAALVLAPRLTSPRATPVERAVL
jgi:hypothetical protein